MENYLQQLFPKQRVRKHVLKLLSQIVKGEHPHKKLYVFQGTGANGKSTFMEFIRKLVDQDCVTVSESVLYRTSMKPSSDFAPIVGKRLVLAETGRDYVSGVIQSLIKGDQFQYHTLSNSNICQFVPQCDVILSTNVNFRKILTMAKQVRIIPFENQFTSEPDPTNPTQLKASPQIKDNFDMWVKQFKEKL